MRSTNKNGEIIIVDDDAGDQGLILDALAELNLSNQIKLFANGEDAYSYLNNQDRDPFIIISDINMPKMTGMELRDKMQVDGKLKLRTIPFLFMTTAAQDSVINAYAHSVRGFFQKPSSYNELKEMFKTILNYWKFCTVPFFN